MMLKAIEESLSTFDSLNSKILEITQTSNERRMTEIYHGCGQEDPIS